MQDQDGQNNNIHHLLEFFNIYRKGKGKLTKKLRDIQMKVNIEHLSEMH